MRSSSIISAFTVLSTLSGTTLCATAIAEDKIETWTLNTLNIEQDGHGPGPSNRTTGTLSIKLSKGDMPFSYCNSTWESYTSVNTVPLGWQKCTAENLWFRLVSRQEIFDFPPVEVDFLEQGVWEEWHDGTKRGSILEKKNATFHLNGLDKLTPAETTGLACGTHHPSRTQSCFTMNRNMSTPNIPLQFPVRVTREVRVFG